MKKETVIAISLGVLLGLGVAVGVSLKTQKKQTNKVTPVTTDLPVTPTIIVSQERANLLEINAPQTGEVTDQKTIIIEGKAQKGGVLVVQSPLSSQILQTESEDFSLSHPLATGENVILISFYPKDQAGTPVEKEVVIYYLKEE